MVIDSLLTEGMVTMDDVEIINILLYEGDRLKRLNKEMNQPESFPAMIHLCPARFFRLVPKQAKDNVGLGYQTVNKA